MDVLQFESSSKKIQQDPTLDSLEFLSVMKIVNHLDKAASRLWFTNYTYLENRGCIYTVFQCKYNTAVFTNEDPPHARYVKPQHSLHATILLVPAAKAIRVCANFEVL